MNDNEFYTFEDDRKYIQPTLSRDEQLDFVSTLRDVMGQNTAQIGTQTRNLGTNITSNLGGLTGANSYFAQRYQTPQMESTFNTLKAAAQAQALNDLMNNFLAQAKNRYSQAYRRAAKSSGDSSGSIEGLYDKVDNTSEAYDQMSSVSATYGKDTPYTTTTSLDGYVYTTDEQGRMYYTDDPRYTKGEDGFYRTSSMRTKETSDKLMEIFNHFKGGFHWV